MFPGAGCAHRVWRCCFSSSVPRQLEGGQAQRDPRSAASGQEQPCLLTQNATPCFPAAGGPARTRLHGLRDTTSRSRLVPLCRTWQARLWTSVMNIGNAAFSFLFELEEPGKVQHLCSFSACREHASTRLFPLAMTPPSRSWVLPSGRWGSASSG